MAVVFLWSGRIIPFCHLSLWLLADIKRFGRILIPLGGDVFHFAGVCGRFHGGVGVSFLFSFPGSIDLLLSISVLSIYPVLERVGGCCWRVLNVTSSCSQMHAVLAFV
jgi:hypothetical protein